MLSVQHLSLTKQNHRILTDLTFQLPLGVTALIGPSGSGKTSLLRCLAGLEQYQGSIQLNDHPMRQVGFVEQDSTLFPHFTAYDNIAYTLKLRKKTPSQIRQAVTTLADQLQITSILQHYPHQLSGGEQRRVMLARTLIYQPDILLFDEPFAGVDTLLRVELVKLLTHLLAERVVPTVYVTHDLAEADYVSQHRLILKAGRFIDPTDPWLETFLQQRF